MAFRQSIYGSGRARRAVLLTSLIIALNAVLIWTLAHTDIVAFATTLVAAVVLVSGMFWATGPQSVAKLDNHRIRQAGFYRLVMTVLPRAMRAVRKSERLSGKSHSSPQLTASR